MSETTKPPDAVETNEGQETFVKSQIICSQNDSTMEIGAGTITSVKTEVVDEIDESASIPITENNESINKSTTENVSTSESITEKCISSNKLVTENISEPTTENVEMNSEPTTENVEMNSKPTTENVEMNSEPTTENVEMNSEPTTENVEMNSKPTTENVEMNSEPTTENVEMNSKPTTENVEINSEPITKNVESKSVPVTETITSSPGNVSQNVDHVNATNEKIEQMKTEQTARNHNNPQFRAINLFQLDDNLNENELICFIKNNLDKDIHDQIDLVFFKPASNSNKKYARLEFKTVEHARKALNQLESILDRPFKIMRPIYVTTSNSDDPTRTEVTNKGDDPKMSDASFENVPALPSQSKVSEDLSKKNYEDAIYLLSIFDIDQRKPDNKLNHTLFLKDLNSNVQTKNLYAFAKRNLKLKTYNSITDIRIASKDNEKHGSIIFDSVGNLHKARYFLDRAANPPFKCSKIIRDKSGAIKREHEEESNVPSKMMKLDDTRHKETRVLFLNIRNAPTTWETIDVIKFLASKGINEVNSRVKFIYREYKPRSKDFNGRCHIMFTNAAVAKVAYEKIKTDIEIKGTQDEVKFEYPDSEFAIPWLPNDRPDFKAIKVKMYEDMRKYFKPYKNDNEPLPIYQGDSAKCVQNDTILSNEEMEETYGLDRRFLEAHSIKLPLTTKIVVENLSPEYNDGEKIRKLFGVAGKVENVQFDLVSQEILNIRVEFDHPVEAVQAISMFHGKIVYGNQILVKMDYDVNTFKSALPPGVNSLGPGVSPRGKVMKNIRQTIELQTAVNTIVNRIKILQDSIESLQKIRSIQDSIESLQKNLQAQIKQGQKTKTPQQNESPWSNPPKGWPATSTSDAPNPLAELVTSLTNTKNNPLAALSALLNPLLQQHNTGGNTNQPASQQAPAPVTNAPQQDVTWNSNNVTQSTPGSTPATNNVRSTNAQPLPNNDKGYMQNSPQMQSQPNETMAQNTFNSLIWQSMQGQYAAAWQNSQGASNWASAQYGQGWPNIASGQNAQTDAMALQYVQGAQNVPTGQLAQYGQNMSVEQQATGQNPTVTTGQYAQAGPIVATGQYAQGGPTVATGQYPQGGPTAATGQYPQAGSIVATGQYPQGGPTAATGQYAQGGPTVATGQYPQGGQTAATGQYAQGGPTVATGQYPQGGPTTATGQYAQGGPTVATGQYPQGGPTAATGQYAQGGPTVATGQYPQGGPTAATGQYAQGGPTVATGQYPQGDPTAATGQYAQVGPTVATGEYAQGSQTAATGQYAQGGPTVATGQYPQGGPTTATGQYAQGGPTVATGQYPQGGPSAATGQYAQGGPTVATGEFAQGSQTAATGQYAQGGPTVATGQYPQGGQTAATGQYAQVGPTVATGEYAQGSLPVAVGKYAQVGPTMSAGQNIQSAPTAASGQFVHSSPTMAAGHSIHSNPKAAEQYVQGAPTTVRQGGSSVPANKYAQGVTNPPSGKKPATQAQSSHAVSAKKNVSSKTTTQKGDEVRKHDPCTVQFSNLPSSVTLTALNSKMREVGDVRTAEMIGPGRALVTFYSPRDAATCIKLLNDTKVDRQPIKVKYYS